MSRISDVFYATTIDRMHVANEVLSDGDDTVITMAAGLSIDIVWGRTGLLSVSLTSNFRGTAPPPS